MGVVEKNNSLLFEAVIMTLCFSGADLAGELDRVRNKESVSEKFNLYKEQHIVG